MLNNFTRYTVGRKKEEKKRGKERKNVEGRDRKKGIKILLAQYCFPIMKKSNVNFSV